MAAVWPLLSPAVRAVAVVGGCSLQLQPAASARGRPRARSEQEQRAARRTTQPANAPAALLLLPTTLRRVFSSSSCWGGCTRQRRPRRAHEHQHPQWQISYCTSYFFKLLESESGALPLVPLVVASSSYCTVWLIIATVQQYYFEVLQ